MSPLAIILFTVLICWLLAVIFWPAPQPEVEIIECTDSAFDALIASAFILGIIEHEDA